jgi:hypothetical protein
MANTIEWGQGAVNNTIGWGKGKTNNTINWAEVYDNSPSGETNITGSGGVPPFTNTYSFLFDGIDERVETTSNITSATEFTLSFWIKPVAVGVNGKMYPIGQWTASDNYIRLDQLGVIYLRIGAQTLLYSSNIHQGGANNLVLNTWQHIAFIRDNTNSIKCYRNGTAFGPTAGITNTNTLTLNSFGRVISNTFGYEGNLDEISFWNTDQTSNLATISAAPTDLSTYSPINWYRFGDGDTFSNPGGVGDWTLTDNGSAANNATSVNMEEADRVTDVP